MRLYRPDIAWKKRQFAPIITKIRKHAVIDTFLSTQNNRGLAYSHECGWTERIQNGWKQKIGWTKSNKTNECRFKHFVNQPTKGIVAIQMNVAGQIRFEMTRCDSKSASAMKYLLTINMWSISDSVQTNAKTIGVWLKLSPPQKSTIEMNPFTKRTKSAWARPTLSNTYNCLESRPRTAQIDLKPAKPTQQNRLEPSSTKTKSGLEPGQQITKLTKKMSISSQNTKMDKLSCL